MNLKEFWSVLDSESKETRFPTQDEIAQYNEIIKQQKIDIYVAKKEEQINYKINQIVLKLRKIIHFYPEDTSIQENYFNEISTIQGFINYQEEIHEVLKGFNPNDKQVEWIIKRVEKIKELDPDNIDHVDITIEDLQIPPQNTKPQEPIIQSEQISIISTGEHIQSAIENQVEDVSTDTQEIVSQISLLNQLNTKINKYFLSSGALLLLAFILNAAQNPKTSTAQNTPEVQTESTPEVQTESTPEVQTEINPLREISIASFQPLPQDFGAQNLNYYGDGPALNCDMFNKPDLVHIAIPLKSVNSICYNGKHPSSAYDIFSLPSATKLIDCNAEAQTCDLYTIKELSFYFHDVNRVIINRSILFNNELNVQSDLTLENFVQVVQPREIEKLVKMGIHFLMDKYSSKIPQDLVVVLEMHNDKDHVIILKRGEKVHFCTYNTLQKNSELLTDYHHIRASKNLVKFIGVAKSGSLSPGFIVTQSGVLR